MCEGGKEERRKRGWRVEEEEERGGGGRDWMFPLPSHGYLPVGKLCFGEKPFQRHQALSVSIIMLLP